MLPASAERGQRGGNAPARTAAQHQSLLHLSASGVVGRQGAAKMREMVLPEWNVTVDRGRIYRRYRL